MPFNSLQNPFEIKPPEELTAELLHKLFVKEYTEHNALIGNYHTFIYGSRGSGKSMHFRYLEPKCQIIEFGSLEKFLESEVAFIGVYINCNRGDFTTSDFKKLLCNSDVDRALVEKILTHYFVMDIAESTLKTCIEQLGELLDEKKEKRVIDQITELYFKGTEVKSLKDLRKIFRNEKKKINDSVNEFQKNYGIPGNRLEAKLDFFTDVSLEEDTFLHRLFVSLRNEVINKEIPYYLLFDEANELLDFQKKIINTLISQRKHSLICIKVSCQSILYKVNVDLKGRAIQETHDYYLVDLDSLYTTDRNTYYGRIKEIAERRLKIANFITTNVKDFIPENHEDVDKIKKSEEITAKEYDGLPGEKPASKVDYIRKYSKARFFQSLKKTSYGYTGFDNLVHFSSGIIRSFLEPCYSMINEYAKKNPGKIIKEIPCIPYEIQRSEIENYSNSFITKEIKEPMKVLPNDSEERKILEGLNNLIESIGTLFSMRLKNEKSREPRIISFAVKESIRQDFLQKILDYAVQKAFFHQKWYRAKSGHEMLECFILNRRLCPRFQLDLSSFQGRFELSQDDLLLAINDREEFIKKFEKKKEEITQLQLFDF